MFSLYVTQKAQEGGDRRMQLIGTAASGMRVQQLALDVLGNNIANVNTPGFKANAVDFAETLAGQMGPGQAPVATGAAGAGAGQGIQVGAGALYRATGTDFSQGSLVSSANPLDLGIEGAGFFTVTLPDGTIAYTRAGNFRPDASGQIVDAAGNLLSPRVQVPAGTARITVASDGTINGADAQGNPRVLGKIQLALIPNPESLNNMGDNLFLPQANTGAITLGQPGSPGYGQVRSNSLEQSNVDLAQEMTDMIETQRAYELNARLVQDGDTMWGLANALRR